MSFILLLIIFLNNNCNSFKTNMVKNINIDQKIISITPGGFKGFYTLGICHYLKDNYDLSEFLYSGASAGSWNALFLSFKGNNKDFLNNIFDIEIKKKKTLKYIQKDIKRNIVKNYNQFDFDIDKLYVGVSYIDKCKFISKIYNEFESLEDVLDCCVASSHIPFVTGGLTYNYKDKLTFDGGFGKNGILNTTNTFLISPNIWNSDIILNESELNIKKKKLPTLERLEHLYYLGYEDSFKNREKINDFFYNLNK